MKKAIFHSPVGDIIVIAAGGYIVYCNWLHPDCESKMCKMIALVENEEGPEDEMLVKEAITQLSEYFAAERCSFSLPVKLYGTPFQKRVWEELGMVEYGTTSTYGTIARRLGKPGASRSVANACGRNPLALIVGCHRITAAGGRTGGYTGGIEKKLYLMQLEHKKGAVEKKVLEKFGGNDKII